MILLAHNGQSLLGLDSNGLPARAACSTDPNDRRTRGMLLMLRQLSDESNPYFATTEMCIATFGESFEPDYKFPEGGTPSDCFQPVRDGGSGFDFLDFEVSSMANEEQPQGRNPWGPLLDAIGRFNQWADSSAERHIVFFADGEFSDSVVARTAEASGATFDAVMQEALNNEVIIHVVQLDRYDRAVDCDPVTAHGASDEYSRLACATGGNFSFVERAEDLPEVFTNLGRAVPGSYRLQLLAERLATLPLGPYKLAFTLTATVDDRSNSFIFSALAGSGDSTSGRQDTRMSIMNRGDCASDGRSCLPGYVCDDTSATCHTPAPGEGGTDGGGDGSGEGSGESAE